jgi:hypothetical protein
MQPNSEIIIYQTEDQQTKVQVRLENETVWLTQGAMLELFQTTKQNISLHIKNVFAEGELVENSVVKEYLTTAGDSKSYITKHYNLDVIISVGYRVKSLRGTQFRIWATQQLKEYLIKGFVLDDERLKNPNNDYFDDLLERVRNIRTSERRFYQKITDIYATSIDYDPNTELTKSFFATVQNKMHWAIHGRTAAELIAERADAGKPNMGLSCFHGNRIKKEEVLIAKNYLTENELKELNLVVDQYLSFAELQAMNRKSMTMLDWINKLDSFLKLNEKNILQDAGKISQKLGQEIALIEFKKFRKIQDHNYLNDFDRRVKKYLEEKDDA